jgi:predicted XRE-type DNA-binding protein
MTRRLFWENVNTDGECWIWTACCTDGYGRYLHDGKMVRAHRYVYEQVIGAIPDGMVVCHSCDNRSCVRPGHLFVGTNQENLTDMVAKGRSLRGTKNNAAKLTDQQVIEIRNLLTMNACSQRTIAARYGVCQTTIGFIARGQTWTHLVEQVRA